MSITNQEKHGKSQFLPNKGHLQDMNSGNPRIKYLCKGCGKLVSQIYGEPTKGKDGKTVMVYLCKKCTDW